jgi:hypothetical protein
MTLNARHLGLLAAAALAFAAGPAGAEETTEPEPNPAPPEPTLPQHWFDGGADAPESVDFNAIAALHTATGDAVVAVGRDTELKKAVVYRLAGNEWRQDEISASVGLAEDSCLTSVSVTQGAAWAVGSQGGGCGGEDADGSALVIRFPVEAESLTAPPVEEQGQSWRAVEVTGMTSLQSVSLAGTQGYVAAADGSIRAVTDGAVPTLTTVESKPSTATLAGVAAHGSGGFAVGDSAPASGVRFFSLDSASATAAPSTPASTPLSGVAALGPDAAVAPERPVACAAGGPQPTYWYRKSGLWQRAASDAASFPPGSELRAASIAPATGGATEAIAGAAPSPDGSDCAGIVWFRTSNPSEPGGWTRTDPLGAPLSGVAVVDSQQMWAAGEEGTILRYDTRPPVKPPVEEKPPPGGTEQPPTGGNEQQTQTVTETSAPSADSTPTPQVVVNQPPPAPAPAPPPCKNEAATEPSRLVTGVKVSVQRRRLIVRFVLAGRAKVTIQPRTRGRLVGRVRALVLEAGRHAVAVSYRGKKPPTQLRIVARAKPKSNCNQGERKPRG